jgi:queuine tRNA-ribosyltransferase
VFQIDRKITGRLGRAGTICTPHGAISTPAFVAVGTKATVKSLTPAQLEEIGVGVVLGNAYHLYLEPGEAIVRRAGGIGAFMGWRGPTMTDSGGFQVFSLGAALEASGRSKIAPQREHPNKRKNVGVFQNRALLANIDEDGVTFTSYKDGSEHRFTPERSIEIQQAIGADIIFAFDECTSPTADKKYQREAMERTHRWAARSLESHLQLTTDNSQLLFGIVQGGRFEDLRKESAQTIGSMEFDGFGIGGSFDKRDMGNAVRWVSEILPEEKPRHLLGIGNPLDLFEAVENGCDTFDCVAPTREARTGALYTKHGRINILNARYRRDFNPVDEGCACYTCKNFSAAYVSHLFRSGEILANTLATIHNVHFIVRLVAGMRQAILENCWGAFRKAFHCEYRE